MPIEIEAKFRVSSHGPIREALRSVGAEPKGRVLEWNSIYDRADGSLRHAGMGLRIRTAEGMDRGETVTTLTVKGPPVASAFKVREEIETRISDPDQMANILKLLGFVAILRYQKRRERWVHRDCSIELDEPPFIGLFVEIEGPDEEAIRRVQRDLGLGDAEHVRGSYVRMLLDYCGRHGLADRILRFPE